MLNSTIPDNTYEVRIHDNGISPVVFHVPRFSAHHQKYWEKKKAVKLDILQKIADTVISQPYQLDPELYLQTTYQKEKIKLYRPNHDAVHAARVYAYSKQIMRIIMREAPTRWQNVISQLTAPEQAILFLGAFCLRLGRLNEDSGRGSKHTLYSAILFEQIANQLGFNPNLVANTKEAMYCKAPRSEDRSRYHGFTGESEQISLDKATLFNKVFSLSHKADLVRCWDAKGDQKFDAIYQPLVHGLHQFLENEAQSTQYSLNLLNYAANACIATGNKVHLDSPTNNIHYAYGYNKKKKAKCVKDITYCLDKISQIPKC